jgi:2-dehydro-3-deoxyphosphogluconate aldolase/(4S)-4-hydroxy-2-oxoglutarate aldolase
MAGPTDSLSLATPGPVIPVIVIDSLDDALPLAAALLEGGVRVLEVTLRTPVALRAIVGAGTVRAVADVQAAVDAGCRFAVSPGYAGTLAAACAARGLAFLPGVATATEVMQAAADGHRFLKFFPAAAAGGVPMLKALGGPFADVSFCPTGGVDAASAPDYLALPNVRVVGGSWLTPAAALAARDWPRITALARAAGALRA